MSTFQKNCDRNVLRCESSRCRHGTMAESKETDSVASLLHTIEATLREMVQARQPVKPRANIVRYLHPGTFDARLFRYTCCFHGPGAIGCVREPPLRRKFKHTEPMNDRGFYTCCFRRDPDNGCTPV
jgi:hypothetical protein